MKIIKNGDKKQLIKTSNKTIMYRGVIFAYLTENISAKCSDLASHISISETRTRTVLSSMVDDGIIMTEGSNKNRIYKLKS